MCITVILLYSWVAIFVDKQRVIYSLIFEFLVFNTNSKLLLLHMFFVVNGGDENNKIDIHVTKMNLQ